MSGGRFERTLMVLTLMVFVVLAFTFLIGFLTWVEFCREYFEGSLIGLAVAFVPLVILPVLIAFVVDFTGTGHDR